MSELIGKFTKKNGEHRYVRNLNRFLMEQLTEADNKYKFVTLDKMQFELVGKEEDKIFLFREADILDIKIAKIRARLKTAQEAAEIPTPDLSSQVEEQIKNQGINRDYNQERLQKIKDVKTNTIEKIHDLYDAAVEKGLKNKAEGLRQILSDPDKLKKTLKEYILPADKALIQFYFWECKLYAYQDEMKTAHVEEGEMTKAVTEELQKRMQESLRNYKSYG